MLGGLLPGGLGGRGRGGLWSGGQIVSMGFEAW